jgi:hypothetical protein
LGKKQEKEIRGGAEGVRKWHDSGTENGPGGINYFCISAEGREYVNPEPILVPEPPPVRRLVPRGL